MLNMKSFRHLGQRYVSDEIALMEWNPMLDLIALATVTGDVLLHRLSWQKVWSIASGSTKDLIVEVTALAWRPDGKILAYAYDIGKINLCDVENSETVHVLDVPCVVTSLTWVQCMQLDPEEYRPIYTDRSAEFLQKHFPVNKGYSTASNKSEEMAEDFKRMKGQKDLNILAIGTEFGSVHLHSFGMYPTGFVEVSIKPDKPTTDRVVSVALSQDFRLLTVVLEKKDEAENYSYHYRSFFISLIYDCVGEIKIVSLKFGQISSLLTCLSSTIRAISEAWEDILLEIDTKLHNYAHQKHTASEEATIGDDFLELLMFGNPSDSLEKFLMHDLTESGLKKFGQSIELSYANIQKLVLKHLQNAAASLYYHLNDFKGMAMWTEQFGPIGLKESLVNEAVMATGSFVLKANEIQQVIDNSLKNFKAFFRWLYSVMLRLAEEPIPPEISRLTQQDLNFVAEFLKEHFTIEYDENKKTTVKLERVAQYLKHEDLPYPPSYSGNPWVKFLKDNPQMFETGIIFKNQPEKSLVTMYSDLRKVIDTAVKGPQTILEETAHEQNRYTLCETGKAQSMPKISHFYCTETNYMFTAITDYAPPSSHFYLIREKSTESKSNGVEVIGVAFHSAIYSPLAPSTSSSTEADTNLKILDLKFYNKDTITVLLSEDNPEDKNSSYLLQYSIKPLLMQLKPIAVGTGQLLGLDVPILNVNPFVEKKNCKKLEGMKAFQIAVSGSRKVSCVLFSSKRHIRPFEMDVEDEDEEDEMEHEESIMKNVSKDEILSDEEVKVDKPDKEEHM
ncbi:anaphase-promoting complex subunit 4 [Trichonephila inaurata madagascariensis]|uniref:Anaphase-promoting complex subunit 4 n=1 Tax=Trichonephila inaurata madagascariensis TaxID=2747483 RepID=A0A8X6WQK0_9ARAC|nr:anaphase-promoting complex subunit 4 [Trichonephila inaurata madagascariensis]